MAKIHGKMLYFPFSAINRCWSSFSMRSKEEKETIYHWSSINRGARRSDTLKYSRTNPNQLKNRFFCWSVSLKKIGSWLNPSLEQKKSIQTFLALILAKTWKKKATYGAFIASWIQIVSNWQFVLVIFSLSLSRCLWRK